MTVLLALLGSQWLAAGQMTLTDFIYNNVRTSDPLRGNPPGNIWNPPVPGSNILECGKFLNRDNLGVRVPINAGETFQINGKVFLAQFGTGSIAMTIKYGKNPVFSGDGIPLGGLWPLNDLQRLPDSVSYGRVVDPVRDGYEWTFSEALPTNAYTAPATIQIEYVTPKISLSADDVTVNITRSKFYQCIDLKIINGRDPPPGGFPPDGLGLPPASTADSSGSSNLGVKSATGSDSSGLSALTIALIVIAMIMACLLMICLYLMCKQPAEDDKYEALPDGLEKVAVDKDKQNQPIMANTVRGQQITDRQTQESLDHEAMSLFSASPPNSAGEPVVNPQSARHFHFRYVENDGEHIPNDSP